MRTVEKWKWRIRWGGGWKTTRIPYTEEQVRREHPEAERVPGTRTEVQMPETEAEQQAAYEAMRRPPKEFQPE